MDQAGVKAECRDAGPMPLAVIHSDSRAAGLCRNFQAATIITQEKTFGAETHPGLKGLGLMLHLWKVKYMLLAFVWAQRGSRLSFERQWQSAFWPLVQRSPTMLYFPDRIDNFS